MKEYRFICADEYNNISEEVYYMRKDSYIQFMNEYYTNVIEKLEIQNIRKLMGGNIGIHRID